MITAIVTSNSSIYIAMAVLFYLVSLGIGLYYHQGIKNFRDFALGGQNFSFITILATTTATIIGGGTTFGFSEMLYNAGFVMVFLYLGGIMRKFITAYVLGEKIA